MLSVARERPSSTYVLGRPALSCSDEQSTEQLTGVITGLVAEMKLLVGRELLHHT